VREQFDTPIGRFEGIEEPLARIGGLTYLMNAARRLTLGAIDRGEKPAVITAIVKAYLTEAMRDVVNDAMDIRAGAAVSRGPRNILEPIFRSVPIAITVEGANILTRSMIIYGQGAIRCHPYVREEMQAVASGDLAVSTVPSSSTSGSPSRTRRGPSCSLSPAAGSPLPPAPARSRPIFKG